MLASFVMILPAHYTGSNELMVSRVAAIMLLIMYCCLLIFVLFTHKDLVDLEEATNSAVATNEKDKQDSSTPQKVISESEDDKTKENVDNDDDDLEMSLVGSTILLFVATTLVALLSDYLVGAIAPMSKSAHISEGFVGMILLPIIGNAVEHITAIRVARKKKMGIALSIAIGSATQVAMFVVSLAVIIGWIIDVPMTLDFQPFEVQMFIYTSIIIFALISDGKSNWLEGAMLLCLYFMIAVAVWDQNV